MIFNRRGRKTRRLLHDPDDHDRRSHSNAWTVPGLIRVGFQGVSSRITQRTVTGQVEVGQAGGGRNLMATAAVAALYVDGQSQGLDRLLDDLQLRKGSLFISSHYDTTPIQVTFGSMVEDLQPAARYLVMDEATGFCVFVTILLTHMPDTRFPCPLIESL
jgi:hypothetical protein